MDDGDPHRVLTRNAACHQCRRRKLKCDAIRPTCGNCRKPRQRGPIKYEPPEACTWDEVRGPSARTLRKREAKQRSEAQGVTGMRTQPPEWAMNGSGQPSNPYAARVDDEMYMPMEPMRHSAKVDSMPVMPGTAMHYNMAQAGPSSATIPDVEWGGQQSYGGGVAAQNNYDSVKTHGFSRNDLPDDPSWNNPQELIFSSWSRDLPVPSVVNHIVQVFFERVPTVTRMFNRGAFLAKLQLPPQHSEFPLVTLHGILAATAPYISVDALASRAYFPTGSSLSDQLHPERDFAVLGNSHQPSGMLSLNARLGGSGTPLSRFQMWHRRKCVEGLSSQISFGQGLLEAMYATALVSYTDYSNGWFVDMWMESMSGVRLGTGLGMNNSSFTNCDTLDRTIARLLPPVKCPSEQAERDRLWWMAYSMEKLVCSGMSWPTGIADDEITVGLPVTQAMYEGGGDNVLGIQTLQAPDLYSYHPPELLDPLPLLVKALKLFHDTNTFMRRYARGEHTYVRYMSDPTLRSLLSDINAFRTSWPPKWRNATRTMDDGSQVVDPDLFLVIGFTHASVVNLGEPLITHQTWANDAAKMVLSAIRAILSLLYDINATSYDITLLPPQASFLCILAPRCLGRFVNAARLAGDRVAAGVFEAEYQAFETAQAQMMERHPIARRHLKRLQFFRTAWVQPGQLTAKLAYDKDQVWDEEFENKQKTNVSSSGSQASPTNHDMGTPIQTRAQLSPGSTMPQPLLPQGPPPIASSDALRMGSALASPMSASGHTPHGLSPHSVGVQSSGVPSPVSVAYAPGVQLQNAAGGIPRHLGAPVHFTPAGGPMPPPVGLPGTSPIQNPPLSQVQRGPPAMPQPMRSNIPPGPGGEGGAPMAWFQGMSGFDINSYSFDVDSMLALLQAENPNATFDGTTAFSLSTV